MQESFEIAPRAVARVAGWPLETLDLLRSPAFVTELRALHAAEHDLAQESVELCDRLAAIVPELQPADRHFVLGLRRALHRSVEPVAAPDLLATHPTVGERLGDHGPVLAVHLSAQTALADRRAEARTAYARHRADERERFLAVALTPAFGRALAVGAPHLLHAWQADRAADAGPPRARTRRRELAVVSHLLRAAGRPVPSALWAGVAPVEPADDGGGPIGAVATPPAVAVGPDIGPWLAVANALAEPLPPLTWTPGGSDPWEQLRLLGDLIPGPAGDDWRAAVGMASAAAERLRGLLLDDGPVEAVATEMARIGVAFDSLRPPLDEGSMTNRPPVRIDWTLPVELRWTEAERAHHAHGVGAVARFVATDGGPALWRQAAGAKAGLAPGTDRDLADAVASMLPAGARAPGAVPPDRVGAFGGFADAAITDRAGRLARRWEARIEPDHRADRIHLAEPGDVAAPAGVSLGPAGSVLVEPSGRYLGIRPGPAVYVAGHAGVADGGAEALRAWLAELEAAGGRGLEVVAADPVNLTIASGPRTGGAVIDLRDGIPGGWAVFVDRHGRAWLVDEAGVLHVPHVPHLSLVGVRDAASALLQAAASSFGETVPAGVFPMLPAEWADWRHLPEVQVEGGAVVARERFVVDGPALERVAAAEDFDQFDAWVALADRLGLPPTVTARVGGSPNEPGRVVPVDSILAVETLFHDQGRSLPHLVLEAGPSFADAVVLPSGGHHVVQVAASWRDTGYWARVPPPWDDGAPDMLRQMNVAFAVTSEGPRIDWAELGALVAAWRAEGLVDRWFFVRKPPGLRLRFEVADHRAFTEAVATWSASLPLGTVRSVRPARYRPEAERFGGAAGMALAHDLWFATAPLAVALERADPARTVRYAIAARAGQALCEGSGADEGEVWVQLAQGFDLSHGTADGLTTVALRDGTGFAAGLAPEARAIDRSLQALAHGAAEHLRSTVADRRVAFFVARWVADATLFQWNMFGLGLNLPAMSSMLCAARETTLRRA